jgi:hypothetical protein
MRMSCLHRRGNLEPGALVKGGKGKGGKQKVESRKQKAGMKPES